MREERSTAAEARKIERLDPDIIDGYQIMQRIGRGSTGYVFRAVQKSMRREVALKILSPKLAARAGFAKRFLREAQMAGAVHHPNVITCYDTGESQGYIYQALELLEGGDLNDHLRNQPPDERGAVAILLDCARGLEGIHAAGLIHGDINPGNIYIGADGMVKLGDLGLARSLFTTGSSGSGERISGPIQVPSPFTAPECFGDDQRRPDIRADIYALGSVMYLTVTGALPFLPNTDEEREWLEADPEEHDPRLVQPDCSAGVAAVVMRAMAMQPEDRYQNPTELREDLERLSYHFAPIHARGGSGSRYATADSSGDRPAARRGAPSPATRAPAPAKAATPARKAEQTRNRQQRRPFPIVTVSACVTALLGGVLAVLLWTSQTPNHRQTITDDAVAAEANTTPGASLTPADEVPAPATATAAKDQRSAIAGPAWSIESGTDTHGRWAVAIIAGHPQRFRHCPAGSFIRDSDHPDGGHAVTISKDFWLAETELTQAVYHAVMGENPSAFPDPDHPVESVSWQDCQDFLRQAARLHPALPLQLPSEAQWEYASRAGGEPVRASEQRDWTRANSEPTTHAVAALAPNAWGLHDMLGNVMEWCADAYGPYRNEAQADPLNEEGLFRVARGGSWSLDPESCSSGQRHKYQPVTRFFFLGLRLAVPTR